MGCLLSVWKLAYIRPKGDLQEPSTTSGKSLSRHLLITAKTNAAEMGSKVCFGMQISTPAIFCLSNQVRIE